MSKESDFRKMMNNEEDSVKDEIWSNIKDEIYNSSNLNKSNGDVVVLSKSSQKKTLAWIIGVVLLIVGIALASYFTWEHFQPPKLRYCTINDYHLEETSITLQEYAVEKDNKICYINWYEDSVYIYSQQFILNDTNESICFYEQSVLNDGNFCHLYVTDNRTDIDVLELFKNIGDQNSYVDNILINWNNELDSSYAMFEFNNYKYYLKVEGSVDQTYLFELINRLLESK